MLRQSKDKRSCCVLSCRSNRYEHHHRFPKDESTGRKWIKVSGNVALQYLTYKEVHVKRYVICCKHFKSTDYSCGAVRKLKQGTVPSLLLPDNIENVSSNEGGDAEEIDVAEIASSSREINLAPSTLDFSPVTYRNWICKSPDSVSLRLSSLVGERDDLMSTPKSSRNKLSEEISLAREAKDITPGTDSIREAKDITPGTDSIKEAKDITSGTDSIRETKDITRLGTDSIRETKDITSGTDSIRETKDITSGTDSIRETKDITSGTDSIRETKDITPGTDSIRECIFSEEIRAEGETANEDIETSDVNEIENAASSTKGLKSRGFKRLIWKNTELDENTRKMYEHVLEAKREIHVLKRKNLRYCNMHWLKYFQSKTKYTTNF